MTVEEYESKKKALLEEIERAFEGVERGNGTTLHQAIAIDRCDGPLAERAGRRQDTDTRWQDIPPTDVPEIVHVLNFMNPAGFRYYLPAYLIWYVKDMDEPVQFEPISMFFIFLTGGDGPIMDFHYSSKFSILNREQARAVARFLEFQIARAAMYFDEDQEECVDEYEGWQEYREQEISFLSGGAEVPLKRYWGQFLP